MRFSCLSANWNLAKIYKLINASAGLTKEEMRLGLKLALNSNHTINISSIAEHLLEYKINRFRSFNLNFVGLPNTPDFGGLDLSFYSR
jgi:hypothetical protein